MDNSREFVLEVSELSSEQSYLSAEKFVQILDVSSLSSIQPGQIGRLAMSLLGDPESETSLKERVNVLNDKDLKLLNLLVKYFGKIIDEGDFINFKDDTLMELSFLAESVARLKEILFTRWRTREKLTGTVSLTKQPIITDIHPHILEGMFSNTKSYILEVVSVHLKQIENGESKELDEQRSELVNRIRKGFDGIVIPEHIEKKDFEDYSDIIKSDTPKIIERLDQILQAKSVNRKERHFIIARLKDSFRIMGNVCADYDPVDLENEVKNLDGYAPRFYSSNTIEGKLKEKEGFSLSKDILGPGIRNKTVGKIYLDQNRDINMLVSYAKFLFDNAQKTKNGKKDKKKAKNIDGEKVKRQEQLRLAFNKAIEEIKEILRLHPLAEIQLPVDESKLNELKVNNRIIGIVGEELEDFNNSFKTSIEGLRAVITENPGTPLDLYLISKLLKELVDLRNKNEVEVTKYLPMVTSARPSSLNNPSTHKIAKNDYNFIKSMALRYLDSSTFPWNNG